MAPEPTFWQGARLGYFQAHALVSPVGALVALLLGAPVVAGLLAVGGAFGWYAWWHDYKLAWRLRQRRQRG